MNLDLSADTYGKRKVEITMKEIDKEREYIVESKDVQQAVLQQREADQEFNKYLSELEQSKKEYLEKYMAIVEHVHFLKRQRSYCQGFLDGIEMLSNLGLTKECKNIGKLLKEGKKEAE